MMLSRFQSYHAPDDDALMRLIRELVPGDSVRVTRPLTGTYAGYAVHAFTPADTPRRYEIHTDGSGWEQVRPPREQNQ